MLGTGLGTQGTKEKPCHLCAQGDSLLREIKNQKHKTMGKGTCCCSLAGGWREIPPPARRMTPQVSLPRLQDLSTAIGTGHTPHLEQLKFWTEHTKQQLQTMENRQHRATLPERKEQKGASYDRPAYYLEAASTQQHRGRNPNGAQWSHQVRKQKFDFTELEFLGCNTRGEGTAHTERVPWRSTEEPPWISADLHMCGVNLHKAEEGTNGRKATGQTICGAHTAPERVHIPTHESGETS